ncbi:MAG: ParB N-terminal domain-containing protein [Candidatus Wildermuthbacteria bacterium]|nr:ParB N-terminal domain-containing protein [Candidatus Wildermuthbacteria bacterium]
MSASIGAQPVVVKPAQEQPGKFELIIGERRLELARAAGQTAIDVTLQENLDEQEASELQLSEYYHHEDLPPMSMGKAFLRHRDRFGVSQQELARRTGITPGTIHHYESLVRHLAPDLAEKVEKGLLTFKEARSIADITDYERQREIAEPFVAGRLSSVYVEKVVGYAKKAPERPIQEVLEDVLRGTKAAAKMKKPEQAPRAGVDLNRLETSVLEVAGVIDAVQLQTVPEYRRLKLISTLRILEAKTKIALGFLSAGQAREAVIPRSFTRPVPLATENGFHAEAAPVLVGAAG